MSGEKKKCPVCEGADLLVAGRVVSELLETRRSLLGHVEAAQAEKVERATLQAEEASASADGMSLTPTKLRRLAALSAHNVEAETLHNVASLADVLEVQADLTANAVACDYFGVEDEDDD